MNARSHPVRMLALGAALASGCVVDRDVGSLTGTGSSSGSGTSDPETSTDAVDDTTGDDSERLDLGSPDVPTEECASVGQTTMIDEAPSDIVIAVAQSISHDQLEATFQNFSLLIGDGNVDDARVVMLAGYPSNGGGVCIDEPPLGVGECPANDDNPPMYMHVDETIDAQTLLAQILQTHPQWGPSMRPEAKKHLWVVTLEDPSMDPGPFVAELSALDPSFATVIVHAMVPLMATEDCSSVVPGSEAGSADQLIELAMSTGGVFEDLCDYSVKLLFDQMLDRIQEVALSCDYDIPPPPDGQVFDRERVNVDYDDGFGLQTIGYVEDISDCVSVNNGWYYDDPVLPTQILMCPQTCARFDALQATSIEIRFGCTTVPAA